MKQLGKFITFEGIDGAGKSTHIPYVIDLIRQHGINVVSTREPGGTPLGERLRDLVLNEKMHLETEALLMFAARRENLAQVIEPALQRGDWVISDRFTDSSFAYQGGGRKLALEKLNALEQWVHPKVQPDLTLLFDVPLEVARERLDSTRIQDKFEQEKADFFAAARAEYLRRAAEFPERFQVVDSTRPIPDIRELLSGLISQLIARQRAL
ncbi:dTMP kinase [Undibacterium sp.]|jgi:dTMP kinase|uniref:dTMP kinase n=1 Tax=Undibacterium sp. TaxID=1914977 RepID=UPI002C36248F|nr:dTMP kinase [Undibacterium sp.]HTD04477.1 dTMP kinase [Undibacterium sp.]